MMYRIPLVLYAASLSQTIPVVAGLRHRYRLPRARLFTIAVPGATRW
jgi:hypothetical protein